MEDLLRPGSRWLVRCETADCTDDYGFVIQPSRSGLLVRCDMSLVPDEHKLVLFTEQALASSAELLSGNQGNYDVSEKYGEAGRSRVRAHSLARHGVRQKGLVFERATPPFLLSKASAERVGRREPLELTFVYYLGKPFDFRYLETKPGEITVDGKQRKLRVVRYVALEDRTDYEIAYLDICENSRVVHRITRDDDVFTASLLDVRRSRGAKP